MIDPLDTTSCTKDQVICRVCEKGFASVLSLNKHANLEHENEFNTGDPSKWTKFVAESNKSSSRKDGNIITRTGKEIIPQIPTESLTALFSGDINYLIVQSDDINVEIIKEAMKSKKKVHEKNLHKEKKIFVKKNQQLKKVPGPFTCTEVLNDTKEVCYKTFTSCCDYSTHYRDTHQKKKRKVIKCQVCEKMMLPNLEEGACFKCTFQNCEKQYSDVTEMAEHLKLHPKNKPFKCIICQKRFAMKNTLLNHYSTVHSAEKQFECKICHKTFGQKVSLKCHLRIHTNENPFKCVVCERAFSQTTKLRSHMRSHTNIAPYSCPLCDKRFKQNQAVKIHMRKFHGQDFPSAETCQVPESSERQAECKDAEGMEVDVQISESQEVKVELGEEIVVMDGEYIIQC